MFDMDIGSSVATFSRKKTADCFGRESVGHSERCKKSYAWVDQNFLEFLKSSLIFFKKTYGDTVLWFFYQKMVGSCDSDIWLLESVGAPRAI